MQSAEAGDVRVALVTVDDLAAPRWNGMEILGGLQRRGVPAHMFALHKKSPDPDVIGVARFKGRDRINAWLNRMEARSSVQSTLYPWSLWLGRDPVFRQADVVHLHIFHLEYLGLPFLPRLLAGKAVLVTLHDAWPITGHCVYPAECDGYTRSCEACPRLDLPFPMRTDRAAQMLTLKRRVWTQTGAHFHVTTDYMVDMAARSSVVGQAGVSKIPLGIDVGQFCPPVDRLKARAALGVEAGPRLVVGLRATGNVWKGVPLAIEAVRQVGAHVPITVVTFQQAGMFTDMPPGVQVIDLGWVSDEAALVAAYQAMDLFLMPSNYESFGFMALEAMACGVPPVVFAGTTMQEILGDGAGGYVVQDRTAAALAEVMQRAFDDEDGRLARADAARERAVTTYALDRYVDSMLDLYRRLAAARRT